MTKRPSMTKFKCCVCGYGSLVRSNFKFDQHHKAYCIKHAAYVANENVIHFDKLFKHAQHYIGKI